jgi:hypothetical protein
MPELAAPTEIVQTDSVPSNPNPLASLTSEERRTWREKGTLPTKADSAPAKTEEVKEEAVTADSAPATERPGSEPEKTQDASRQKTKPNADQRKEQLSAEIRELIRQRDELRATVTPREPQQASQPAPEAKKNPEPTVDDKDEKGQFKYKTLDEFQAAQRKWDREQVLAEVEERTAKSAREREQQEAQRIIQQRVQERIETARSKHDDFDAVALNADLPIKIGSAVDVHILDSENGAELLYYLGQHPEELDRIQGKATITKDANGNMQFKFSGGLNPAAQIRELTKLEIGLSEPKKEPVEPKTRAPKPPSEVGGRGTHADDPVLSAAQAGDFRAFKAAANRKALGK